jgi:hypothetical protein
MSLADFAGHADGYPQPDICWLWTRGKTGPGYAATKIAGKFVPVHRAMYELLVGPISVGLVLDHLCGVRHCVNPSHLEPVTMAENVRRGHAARTFAHAAQRPQLDLFAAGA